MISHYTVTYERVLYFVGLDSPAIGVSVETEAITSVKAVSTQNGWAGPLKETMEVKHIDCYVPGSMEEVLREAYLLSPETVAYQMGKRISWPGFGGLVPLGPP